MDEEQFLELCDHTNLLKRCVTRLWLFDISDECALNILQFDQLRHLYLANVKIPLDILLKSLPNLCHLEAKCRHIVESSEGDAHFTFKSVFYKRWIYVYMYEAFPSFVCAFDILGQKISAPINLMFHVTCFLNLKNVLNNLLTDSIQVSSF